MPERVTIYDLETGGPTETFAVDAIEIVKSDPTRYAYKLPADWSPKAPPQPVPMPEAQPGTGAEGMLQPETQTSLDEDAERDALRVEAEGLGIDVDNRWGIATLKTKIAAAKAAAE